MALRQVSDMQIALLESDNRLRELETGMDVVRNTLRTAMKERDTALENAAAMQAELQGETGSKRTKESQMADALQTVNFLTSALETTAEQRDAHAR